MALIVAEPPDGSVTALHETLSAFNTRGQFSARALQRAQPDQLTVTVPHEVYTLTLHDLRAAASLDTATPTSWRYLLEIDHDVVASAETTVVADDTHTLAHINEGPFVAGTIDALSAAERNAAQRDTNLEIRLLHIPALYSMNLWLHQQGAPHASDDTLIAIAPVPAGLEANQPYTPSDLLERLANLAQNIPELASDDTSGG